MMKFTKIAAFITIAILISTAVIAPSADAETKTYTETKFIHMDVYANIVTFGANSTLGSSSEITIYEVDEFNKWYKGEPSTPLKTVRNNELINTESATYGVVSPQSSLIAVGSTSYISETLPRCDVVSYSFTGIKDTDASIHFDFGAGHKSNVKVLIVKATAAATVQSSSVEKQYSNPDIIKSVVAKGQYDEGTDSADIAFKCENTDVYWAFVGYSEEQSVTCSITVNGAATFTDSTVLSVVMIVIAIGLLLGLLYISNKKLIQ